MIHLICALLINVGFATESKDIPLTWKATTDVAQLRKMDLVQFLDHKIKIENFADKRSPPLTKVGENVEKPNDVKIVYTKSNIPEFVSNNFRKTLKDAGLQIVDSGQDVTVSGEIYQYVVTEGNTYEAALGLRLALKKYDKVVWRGTIHANNTRFGRSFKDENYQESFSDVIIEAAKSFIKSEDLKKQFAPK